MPLSGGRQRFAGIGASNVAFAAPGHHQFRIQMNSTKWGFPEKGVPQIIGFSIENTIKHLSFG
jgi:hypothetical protein